MKLFVAIALLILAVLVCEKFEDRLPIPINWIFAVWKKFSHYLGLVMSSIILSVLWIVGIGLYAIIFKLTKAFKKETTKTSYWIDVSSQQSDMKYQF